MLRTRSLLAGAALGVSLAVSGCYEIPDPQLSISPGPEIRSGETATFRNVGDGGYMYQWDLDGDGMFETQTGTSPSASRRYDDAGTVNVSIDAYFEALIINLHGYDTERLTVTAPPPPPATTPPASNAAPVASFTTDADPGYTERTVNFDGKESSDADGRIDKYEWDFESDGKVDATGATATHAYAGPATYQATLKVTDDDGATAKTARAVSVIDGVPPDDSLASAGVNLAGQRGSRFTTTIDGKQVRRGTHFLNGGTLFQSGLTLRGRMKLTGLPAPLEGRTNARWAAAVVFKQHGETDKAKVSLEGYLLADFGRRDRVCLNGRVSGTPTTPFSGRLAVVGGSGVGRRVRGAATITVPAKGTKVSGRLLLPRTRAARKLPKPCRALARTLR